MVNDFCGRCFNYLDFCDCINYDYDLEDFADRSIPKPPDDDPEVGTVWYFRVPIWPLVNVLRANNADKVGLYLLLKNESMWTLEKPVDNALGEAEKVYLSVPVDRLPHNDVLDALANPGGINKPVVMPWEFEYFNFDPDIADVKRMLAEIVRTCSKKSRTKARMAFCVAKNSLKEWFKSFDKTPPPLPPELVEKLSNLPYGYLNADVVLAVLLAVLSPEQLSELNNGFNTLVDYAWVNQALIDGTDPPANYQELYDDPSFSKCFFNIQDCVDQTVEFPAVNDIPQTSLSLTGR